MFLGIGRPPGQMDPKAFLLQNFNATAQGRVSLLLVFSSHQLRETIYSTISIYQTYQRKNMLHIYHDSVYYAVISLFGRNPC